ncbi:hypothetical protein E2C01_026085 [Portunus trituberculatus]|uniref:Uncharacterized protein n=1 Tax=Portunus trituberculatus TaxID=210409 RepID=A0A5B7EHG0_PORTR|nr:hypothetical protein [Portunus trituberculatus]
MTFTSRGGAKVRLWGKAEGELRRGKRQFLGMKYDAFQNMVNTLERSAVKLKNSSRPNIN